MVRELGDRRGVLEADEIPVGLELVGDGIPDRIRNLETGELLPLVPVKETILTQCYDLPAHSETSETVVLI